MKKQYIFLAMIIISNISIGQNKASKDKEEVKQLIKGAFDDIWSDLDSNKIKKYHTDDFLLLENGELWNNDSIRNYQTKQLKSNKKTIRKNKFDFVKVVKLDNTIWIAYHNYATWELDNKIVGNAHWLESIVAIKTKEGWRLQMLHSTRVRNKDH